MMSENCTLDIHICGGCRAEFSDIFKFIQHKKECYYSTTRTKGPTLELATLAGQFVQHLQSSDSLQQQLMGVEFHHETYPYSTAAAGMQSSPPKSVIIAQSGECLENVDIPMAGSVQINLSSILSASDYSVPDCAQKESNQFSQTLKSVVFEPKSIELAIPYSYSWPLDSSIHEETVCSSVGHSITDNDLSLVTEVASRKESEKTDCVSEDSKNHAEISTDNIAVYVMSPKSFASSIKTEQRLIHDSGNKPLSDFSVGSPWNDAHSHADLRHQMLETFTGATSCASVNSKKSDMNFDGIEPQNDLMLIYQDNAPSGLLKPAAGGCAFYNDSELTFASNNSTPCPEDLEVGQISAAMFGKKNQREDFKLILNVSPDQGIPTVSQPVQVTMNSIVDTSAVVPHEDSYKIIADDIGYIRENTASAPIIKAKKDSGTRNRRRISLEKRERLRGISDDLLSPSLTSTMTSGVKNQGSELRLPSGSQVKMSNKKAMAQLPLKSGELSSGTAPSLVTSFKAVFTSPSSGGHRLTPTQPDISENSNRSTQDLSGLKRQFFTRGKSGSVSTTVEYKNISALMQLHGKQPQARLLPISADLFIPEKKREKQIKLDANTSPLSEDMEKLRFGSGQNLASPIVQKHKDRTTDDSLQVSDRSNTRKMSTVLSCLDVPLLNSPKTAMSVYSVGAIENKINADGTEKLSTASEDSHRYKDGASIPAVKDFDEVKICTGVMSTVDSHMLTACDRNSDLSVICGRKLDSSAISQSDAAYEDKPISGTGSSSIVMIYDDAQGSVIVVPKMFYSNTHKKLTAVSKVDGVGVSQVAGTNISKVDGVTVCQVEGARVSKIDGVGVSKVDSVRVSQVAGARVSKTDNVGVRKVDGVGVSQVASIRVSQIDGVRVSQVSGTRVSKIDGVGVSQVSGIKVNQIDGIGVSQVSSARVSKVGDVSVSQVEHTNVNSQLRLAEPDTSFIVTETSDGSPLCYYLSNVVMENQSTDVSGIDSNVPLGNGHGFPVINGTTNVIPSNGNVNSQHIHRTDLLQKSPGCASSSDISVVSEKEKFIIKPKKTEKSSRSPGVSVASFNKNVKMASQNVQPTELQDCDVTEQEQDKKSRLFTCRFDKCRYTTSLYKDFQRHFRRHTGEKPYQCPDCGKNFNRTDKLKIHQRRHTGLKPFQCQLCDYAAIEGGSLKKHMRIHTDERPFKCQICSYASRNSSQLIVHLRTHTGDSPFHCTKCPAKFKINSDLKRHMRIHTGEKPFQCDQCEYKSTNKGNLKTHMKINHLEENETHCPACGFVTSSRKRFKEHERTHNVPVVTCSLCDYTCANFSQLRSHANVHNAVKPYRCKFCPYSSRQSGNLKKHVQNMHLDKLRARSRNSRVTSASGVKLQGVGRENVLLPVAERSGAHRHRSTPGCRKLHACRECGTSFVREDSLRCHMKQHRLRENIPEKYAAAQPPPENLDDVDDDDNDDDNDAQDSHTTNTASSLYGIQQIVAAASKIYEENFGNKTSKIHPVVRTQIATSENSLSGQRGQPISSMQSHASFYLNPPVSTDLKVTKATSSSHLAHGSYCVSASSNYDKPQVASNPNNGSSSVSLLTKTYVHSRAEFSSQQKNCKNIHRDLVLTDEKPVGQQLSLNLAKVRKTQKSLSSALQLPLQLLPSNQVPPSTQLPLFSKSEFTRNHLVPSHQEPATVLLQSIASSDSTSESAESAAFLTQQNIQKQLHHLPLGAMHVQIPHSTHIQIVIPGGTVPTTSTQLGNPSTQAASTQDSSVVPQILLQVQSSSDESQVFTIPVAGLDTLPTSGQALPHMLSHFTFQENELVTTKICSIEKSHCADSLLQDESTLQRNGSDHSIASGHLGSATESARQLLTPRKVQK